MPHAILLTLSATSLMTTNTTTMTSTDLLPNVTALPAATTSLLISFATQPDSSSSSSSSRLDGGAIAGIILGIAGGIIFILVLIKCTRSSPSSSLVNPSLPRHFATPTHPHTVSLSSHGRIYTNGFSSLEHNTASTNPFPITHTHSSKAPPQPLLPSVLPPYPGYSETHPYPFLPRYTGPSSSTITNTRTSPTSASFATPNLFMGYSGSQSQSPLYPSINMTPNPLHHHSAQMSQRAITLPPAIYPSPTGYYARHSSESGEIQHSGHVGDGVKWGEVGVRTYVG